MSRISGNSRRFFTLFAAVALLSSLGVASAEAVKVPGPTPPGAPADLRVLGGGGGNCTPGDTRTFTYSGPVVPIPDAPGPAAQAVVAAAGLDGIVYDVDFAFTGDQCSAAPGATTVGLDHTFVADLQVRLISPDATTVAMISYTDGGGNNFCQTVLDDESAGPNIQTVLTAQEPFTGSFVPNSPLAQFDGGTPNGDWTLEVEDDAGIDVGNIRSFTLTITPAVCQNTLAIPTLGSYGSVLLALALAAATLAVLRRRRFAQR